jgi:hypothetical protein
MTVLDLDPKVSPRALHDGRAERFHPYDRKRALLLAGRPAVGRPGEGPTAGAAS